ncbi:TD and POZ domain-containing protein 4 [Araneus ventricosus]|uniref:TD and POZ domain-containing protein 4 n=1 Tax=Araneus ventricosus TaxID=182803 RepID=A0A4Y2TJK7_ARAVE|nr:TD and POZ domain-containing protein 4 [Araneus ventricosus]
MRKFTFIWFIENFSYCWHETGEGLVSPTFFVEIIHSTSWNLELYPRGEEDPNFMSLYLRRCEDCNGPGRITLFYELSILDANGRGLVSAKREEDAYEFEKGKGYGPKDFFELLGNNLEEKTKVLTSDILRVCCKMWIDEGEVDKEARSCARTRIGLVKISFINIIEKFGILKPDQKKSFDVTSVSKDGFKFSGNIYVKNEPGSEEEVMVDIFPGSDDVHLITCQIYLLSSAGKEVECGKIDTRNYIDRKHTLNFPINLGKNFLDKKIEYLPNDNLTLRCQCTLSTGIEFERIEETFYDLQLTPFLEEKLNASSFASCPAGAKSALADIKSLYKDQILTDVQLKTLTKTFPVHKFILCARSPVFRAMLTTDMKEKNLNCIQVDDLDDSTIEQFLFFLYTDVLENLQWESAMKLYYAADKYQVQHLIDVSSSFLITGMNTINITDLLIIADRHQDSNIKIAVENFICEKGKKIFSSDEWENFMETNPLLAMKTMHLYLKKSNDLIII